MQFTKRLSEFAFLTDYCEKLLWTNASAYCFRVDLYFSVQRGLLLRMRKSMLETKFDVSAACA